MSNANMMQTVLVSTWFVKVVSVLRERIVATGSGSQKMTRALLRSVMVMILG